MRPSPSLLFATVFSVLYLSASAQNQEVITPSYDRIEKYIGCFRSVGDGKQALKDVGQSQGKCRDTCKARKMKYASTTNAEFCYCGNTLPQESDKVDNDKCNQSCVGYPYEPCGSRAGHYTIFLADTSQSDPRLYDGSGQTANPNESLLPTATPTQVTTDSGGKTIIITQTPTTKPEEKETKSGINKAGAAAGAVVGVLVAIAIGVGAFVFIRKQRRKKVEEEYRRSAAVREFHKKPEADLRLDPVMLQRRASDGSIADNQDYSRRILKVTNPE